MPSTSNSIKFPEVIFGLPDSAYKRSDGKLEESILRQRVRLTRNQNRFINKSIPIKGDLLIAPNKYVMINLLASPDTREKFIGNTLHLIQMECIGEVKDTSLPRQTTAGELRINNWELLTLYDYAPDVWEMACNNITTISDLVPIELAYESMPDWVKNACLTIKERACTEMKKWPDLDDSQKAKLAEVHFALSFTAGSDHLTNICSDHPLLLPFYSSILKLEGNSIEDHGEFEGREPQENRKKYASAEDIHRDIEYLVERGKKSPDDEAMARSLVDLSNKLLQWIELHPTQVSLSEEAIPRICTELATIGSDGGLTEMESNEKRIALVKCWNKHFVSNDHSQAGEDAFLKVIRSAERVRNRVKQPLSDSRKNIQAIETGLAKMEASPGSTRTERREVEAKKSELAQERTVLTGIMFEYEDELYSAILPPGENLDTWDAKGLSETAIDEDDVDPSLAAALQKAYQHLTSHNIEKIANEVDERDLDSEPQLRPDPELATGLELKTKPEPEPDSKRVFELERDTGSEMEVEQDQDSTQDGAKEEVAATDSSVPKGANLPEGSTEQSLSESDIGTGTTAIKFDEGKQTELQIDGMTQLEQNGFIEPELINQALSCHILKGNLGHAFTLAKLVEDMELSSDTIPSEILHCAHYGQNVWAYDRSLNKSQRLLYSLDSAMIEKATAARNGGKTVPYLVLVASLQSALFGGNNTNAANLMNAVSGRFDSPVQRLIQLVNDISTHGNMLTLANLREQEDSNKVKELSELLKEVDAWENRILQSKRGYAPIRKAQTYCLENGLFDEIVNILKSGASDQIANVQNFVTEYSSQGASDHLLDECIRESNSEQLRIEVFPSGKAQFFHKVEDLVEICQQWLNLQKQTTSDIQEYCRKIKTLISQCKQSFKRVLDEEDTSLDRQAGAMVAHQTLNNVSRVIDGNDSIIWSPTRVKAWFRYPLQFIRLYGFKDEPVQTLNWLLGQAIKPLTDEEILSIALEKGEVSLAYLMYLYLRDNGDDRKRIESKISEQFLNVRKRLRDQRSGLIGSINRAVMAGRLGADRSTVMLEEIESILDQIEAMERYEPVYRLEEELDRIRKEVSREIGSRLEEMRNEYLEARETMLEILPESPVPDAWIEAMDTAFEEENLLVVDEMLSEIQTAATDGTPILEEEIDVLPILDEFLASDISLFDAIKDSERQQDLWLKVMEISPPLGGLDFSKKFGNLKKVIDYFYEWRRKKPPSSLGELLYKNASQVLELAGFGIASGYNRGIKTTANYQSDEGFASFFIKVRDMHPGTPFPLFGAGSSQPVIIAFKDWSPDELKHYMGRTDMTISNPLVISVMLLDRKKRQDFAHYFKRAELTVLHIDLVMALFLATLPRDTAGRSPIANFLWATVPWTYFNPYVKGDTRYPPPLEMRFGREREITSLMEMTNGAAIVFGGRQLGKSTILQQVKERFHHVSRKQYAFYDSMDKNMDRMEITREKWENVKLLVWWTVHNHLYNQNLTDNLKKDSSAHEIQQSVEKSLLDHPDHKVIMIFDEIDPILNLDSAYDFGIIRGFRDLVCKPDVQGRFKLIIAGLENVKRFEASTNNPLQQLGAPLQVSIMSTRDAQHMLKKPLYAAGYRYESDQVVNDILVETNRHPGLLQIFTHELISLLAKRSRGDIGKQLVRITDVWNVKSNPAVKSLIRNRFDMTLNLDRRYLVIVYGLLSEEKGIRPFTPKEAKEIASSWLPSEFESLTTSQFIAYLDELVGLGVLKSIRGDTQIQYQLRNANIRGLIGDDQEEIDSKLNEAIEQQANSSPLDRHAFFEVDEGDILCPITFRDEKALLGAESRLEGENSKIPLSDSWKYTVSVVVGSPAMGIDKVGESVRRLYETENMLNPGVKKVANEYELFQRNDTDFNSPKDFEKRIGDVLIRRALEKPHAVIVNVTGNQTLAHVVGMIDAAHSFHGKNSNYSNSYPVRVVFCLSPKAYWGWLANPLLTSRRELAQPFINLAPWEASAVSHLLDKLEMTNAPEDVSKVMRYTLGWYISLDIMAHYKGKRIDVHSVSDLGDSFKPLKEIDSKQAKTFLTATGMRDVEGIVHFVKELTDTWDEGFTIEAIGLSIEDLDAFGEDDPDAEGIARWLSDMSIIRRERGTEVGKPLYTLDPAVDRALTVLNVE